MANGRHCGVGVGLRLSRDEARRLDDLARATGRSPAGVLCALVRYASPRDPELLERLREGVPITMEATVHEPA